MHLEMGYDFGVLFLFGVHGVCVRPSHHAGEASVRVRAWPSVTRPLHLLLCMIKMAMTLTPSSFTTELPSGCLVPSVSCYCHGDRQDLGKMGRHTLLGEWGVEIK